MFSLISAASNGEIPLKISSIKDHKSVMAVGAAYDVTVGQTLGIKSQSSEVGLIGFVRIKSVERVTDKTTVIAELIKASEYNLIRAGDELVKFDLSSGADNYKGSTELLVREEAPHTSARFKPLFTQGILIGETAQTLVQNEFLLTWYGLLHYGLFDWMSIGTLAPADVNNSPNITVKVRFLDSIRNTLATGFTLRRIPEGERYTLNWNLMWDAYSNEKSISHTFATLAIYSIEKAEDTTAIKSGGTSTFQTGYEYITDSWGRILYGPNYNFETKAIGAYLAYAKIWDHFNLQATLYSTNVRNPKWSVQDGYVVYLDGYWRF